MGILSEFGVKRMYGSERFEDIGTNLKLMRPLHESLRALWSRRFHKRRETMKKAHRKGQARAKRRKLEARRKMLVARKKA